MIIVMTRSIMSIEKESYKNYEYRDCCHTLIIKNINNLVPITKTGEKFCLGFALFSFKSFPSNAGPQTIIGKSRVINHITAHGWNDFES